MRKENMSKLEIHVYTDGSYIRGDIQVGGALIQIVDNEVVSCTRFVTEDEDLLKHHQVSGEVVPVLYALKEINDHITKTTTVTSVHICYDYTGVKDWLDGTWKKANNAMSRHYMSAGMQLLNNLKSKGVSVQFEKIKSHTGNKYNEYADRIARGSIPEELRPCYIGTKRYFLNSSQLLAVVE